MMTRHITNSHEYLHTRKRNGLATVSELTPCEFVLKIEELEDEMVRNAVGSIVWWDFFSCNMADHHVPDFDGYIEAFKPDMAAYQDVIAGLIHVGYPHKEAVKRVKTDDFWFEENERRKMKRHLAKEKQARKAGKVAV